MDDNFFVQEDETTDEMKLVNEMLVTSTFQNVCSCVKTILDDINLVINRLKAEYTLINYPGSDSSERSIIVYSFSLFR